MKMVYKNNLYDLIKTREKLDKSKKKSKEIIREFKRNLFTTLGYSSVFAASTIGTLSCFYNSSNFGTVFGATLALVSGFESYSRYMETEESRKEMIINQDSINNLERHLKDF